MVERYNHLNTYLKDKFGERTLKICIDGGFTCPNRDGTKSSGGCIFCSTKGSGDLIKLPSSNADVQNIETICNSISSQVKDYFKSYRSKRANKFIVYFQNFTNTYDSIENLKKKYDAALIDNRIVGLDIATRPDCITEDICKLLASYLGKYSVTCELGLQTSNDVTGEIINRHYTSSDFANAVKLLNKYNIDVITHIIIGLPNENLNDLENTINFINNHKVAGIKIHSCYILKDTVLEKMYNDGEYTPQTLEEYLDSLVFAITHLNKNIIIHRISGDSPKDLLVAPSWNTHKKLVLNGIDKILEEKNLWQGMYCK